MTRRAPRVALLHRCFLVSVLLATGCDTDADLSACDIRQAACQEDVFLAVQRARGESWDPWIDRPRMRVISQDAYRKEMIDARERAIAESDDDEFPHFTVVLELLGLLDPERAETAYIDARLERIAATYSAFDKVITIVDAPGDDEDGTAILAHELVHAVQDRDLGLLEYKPADTRDGFYARQAIVEGEAELYENIVMVEVLGYGVDGADWNRYHSERLASARQHVIDAESPEHALYSMLYPLGSRFLTDRFLAGGNLAVRETWETLPSQLAELFTHDVHPPLQCAPPPAPDGYTYEGGTVMGALPLFGAATRFDPDGAWRIATGWRADRLSFFASEDDQTLLVWQIRVAFTAHDQLFEAARDYYGSTEVVDRDGRIHIRLHSTGEPPDWPWTDCQPLDR